MDYFNYLKSLDIFATKVELRFKTKTQFSTYLGLIFSIGIYITCVIFTISTGDKLFKRTKPTITNNLLVLSTADNYTLSSNQFPFFFSFGTLTGDLLNNIGNKYIQLHVKHYQKIPVFDEKTKTTELKSIRKELDWEPCNNNLTHYLSQYVLSPTKNFTETALNNNLKDSISLLTNTTNNNITLGGVYGSEFFSNIYLEISKCDNKTSEVQCATEEEISNKISDQNIQLNYIQHTSNTENYTDPYYTALLNYYTKIDSNFFIQTDVYFIPIETISDIGLFFENYKVDKKWTYYSSREQRLFTYLNNSFGSLVIRMYLNIGLNRTKIIRYYMKAQELAALVGGIIKMLMIVAAVINGFFSKFLFDEALINTFFVEGKMESDGNNIIAHDKNNSIRKNLTNINKNNQVSHLNSNNINNSENIKRIKSCNDNSINKKDTYIDSSLWELRNNANNNLNKNGISSGDISSNTRNSKVINDNVINKVIGENKTSTNQLSNDIENKYSTYNPISNYSNSQIYSSETILDKKSHQKALSDLDYYNNKAMYKSNTDIKFCQINNTNSSIKEQLDEKKNTIYNKTKTNNIININNSSDMKESDKQKDDDNNSDNSVINNKSSNDNSNSNSKGNSSNIIKNNPSIQRKSILNRGSLTLRKSIANLSKIDITNLSSGKYKDHSINIKEFYHINYFQIIGISICPCINYFNKIKQKHEAYTKELYSISDLEEIVNEVALSKSKSNNDINNTIVRM